MIDNEVSATVSDCFSVPIPCRRLPVGGGRHARMVSARVASVVSPDLVTTHLWTSELAKSPIFKALFFWSILERSHNADRT
jgi:hypothetical protein